MPQRVSVGPPCRTRRPGRSRLPWCTSLAFEKSLFTGVIRRKDITAPVSDVRALTLQLLGRDREQCDLRRRRGAVRRVRRVRHDERVCRSRQGSHQGSSKPSRNGREGGRGRRKKWRPHSAHRSLAILQQAHRSSPEREPSSRTATAGKGMVPQSWSHAWRGADPSRSACGAADLTDTSCTSALASCRPCLSCRTCLPRTP